MANSSSSAMLDQHEISSKSMTDGDAVIKKNKVTCFYLFPPSLIFSMGLTNLRKEAAILFGV